MGAAVIHCNHSAALSGMFLCCKEQSRTQKERERQRETMIKGYSTCGGAGRCAGRSLSRPGSTGYSHSESACWRSHNPKRSCPERSPDSTDGWSHYSSAKKKKTQHYIAPLCKLNTQWSEYESVFVSVSTACQDVQPHNWGFAHECLMREPHWLY